MMQRWADYLDAYEKERHQGVNWLISIKLPLNIYDCNNSHLYKWSRDLPPLQGTSIVPIVILQDLVSISTVQAGSAPVASARGS